MKKLDNLEEDKRISLLASDAEFYRKRAQEAIGIPARYFVGCDPYEEIISTSKFSLFRKVGDAWESILNKVRK